MGRLTEEHAEANRTKILTAGAQAFSRSGFSGVTVRDIAKKTKLPLGSHYNYYEDKLALFKAVIARESAAFLAPENELMQYFASNKFPDDLVKLADIIKASITKHETYFKLMYVDVVEFDGKHIRETFSGLEPKFRTTLTRKTGLGRSRKIDPAFAMVVIYLSFYQYFLLSKLFGATKIFGPRSDAQIVSGMIEMFRHGLDAR